LRFYLRLGMEDGIGMGKGKLTMEVERQLRGVKIGFAPGNE